MHLIFLTRGINNSFKQWKSFMECQWFDFRQKPILKDDKGNFLKNPDGTYQYGPETIVKVQGSLRPIQLFEYVFPEESLQEVLAMNECHKDYNELRPEINLIAWSLRKMMGAKKIPDMPDLKKKERWEITQKYTPHQGVAIYPIGMRTDIKKDFIFKDPYGTEAGFNQEGL